MGILWRGKQKFKHLELVPGGTIKGIGAPPPVGDKYYVDVTDGSDSRDGISWGTALKTIAAAVTKCTDLNNDYIYVSAKQVTDVALTEAIVINKRMVHLIGMAAPQGAAIRLVPSEDVNCIELPLDTGDHVEIAGFGFGGGATKAGIAFTGGHSAWIHHCSFGNRFTGGTPKYGIWAAAGYDAQMSLIEDNIFIGSGNDAKGLIATDGILLTNSPGALAHYSVIIRNNIFMGIPGVAINLDGAQGAMILNNQFMLDADTTGAAITIGDDCDGCFIDGNSANFGSADASGNVPWSHSASADDNTFGLNYQGGAASYPAT